MLVIVASAGWEVNKSYFVDDEHQRNYLCLIESHMHDDAVTYMMAHPKVFATISAPNFNSVDTILRDPQMKLWLGIAQVVAGKGTAIRLNDVLKLENNLFYALFEVYLILRRENGRAEPSYI